MTGSESDRLREYQRNAAFAAIVLVISFAALVYLAQSLSDVLVPLVWSAFFAVPLTALIARINSASAAAGGWLLRRFADGDGDHPFSNSLEFSGTVGENRLLVRHSPEAAALLKKADGNPCCGLTGVFSSFLRSRVRVTSVAVEGAWVGEAKVNRLVENWEYYVVHHVEGEYLHMELFLDQAGEYPAMAATPTSERRQITGTLELDGTSGLSWTFAFFTSLGIMALGIIVFVLCISLGIKALQKNLSAYELGFKEFLDVVLSHLQSILPDDTFAELQTEAMDFAKTALQSLATSLASSFQSIGWECLLFVIYLLFWVSEPLPVNNAVAQVVKSYLLLKTVVCLIFAVLMAGLLKCLQCPLWHIFFVVTFLLNYIPEVGAIASAVLTLPAVMFDGNLSREQRKVNTLLLVICGVMFKVITGNFIEVQLYAKRGGSHMRMHPVVMLATMMLCEALLGVTGMFLAVPIMAAVKYYLVSTDVPGSLLNPILVLVEGDEAGPHKIFVDRWRAGYGSTEPSTEAKV